MRAVIFDLDGTLIDAAPDIAAKLNVVITEAGHPALSLETVHGLSLIHISEPTRPY